MFVTAVIGGILLIRYARQEERPDALRSPQQILAERYARGELTEGQYRQQPATLRDAGVLTR